MQWIKYLFILIFVLGAGWSVWLIHTGQYAQLSVTIVLLCVLESVFLFFIYPTVRMDALISDLRKNGVPTQALILGVQGTSAYVNGRPVMRVKVKYSFGKEGEITGEVKQFIPFEVMSRVSPFLKITILVDPKDDRRFVLDF